MTENEAIREFQNIKPHSGMIPVRMAEAVDMAIKALEEVQQYRQIGTVSTCRNTVGICKAMINRGINPDNITECINFEYNLVQRGYDLKKLIEMIDEHKQQFQIGTVEECREAVEKQTAKKVKSISPVKDGDSYVGLIGRCPCCGDILEEDTVYCDCGQRLDWGE